MNTCTAIDTKSAEHNENRKMERSTGSGGEVLQRDRQTLLDQDRQMVQVKKNASKPAKPEDKKCTSDSRRRISNMHGFSLRRERGPFAVNAVWRRTVSPCPARGTFPDDRPRHRIIYPHPARGAFPDDVPGHRIVHCGAYGGAPLQPPIYGPDGRRSRWGDRARPARRDRPVAAAPRSFQIIIDIAHKNTV